MVYPVARTSFEPPRGAGRSGGGFGWRPAAGLLLCAAVSATLTAPAGAAVRLLGDTIPKTVGPPYNIGSLVVGFTGDGTLDVTAGSTLTVAGTSVFGDDRGSKGTGTITGAGSMLKSKVIRLGICGQGTLYVDN
jgi:T5SS/PEP-CTERM-associated repeat protein